MTSFDTLIGLLCQRIHMDHCNNAHKGLDPSPLYRIISATSLPPCSVCYGSAVRTLLDRLYSHRLPRVSPNRLQLEQEPEGALWKHYQSRGWICNHKHDPRPLDCDSSIASFVDPSDATQEKGHAHWSIQSWSLVSQQPAATRNLDLRSSLCSLGHQR